ncbi:MAG: lipoyl synthase [Candidatus Omnitrophica bacterium]|nr:lipoyl synthase [Candidatus Omnitrophota bacterium]MCM8801799.1 lipoyl synthase [Candidatus Omnitrophota bacterium]
MRKIPAYIKKRISLNENIIYLRNLLNTYNVQTVCENAICPNIYECFGKKYASFMILGKNCTRNCKFCGVSKTIPEPIDNKEPERIAEIVKILEMKYVVITSVTRDDLPDGGAGQFKKVVEEIRKKSPETKIELLIPDFNGNLNSLKIIFDSKPDIISHNLETVSFLYPIIRPKSDYNTSLKILSEIKKYGFITKSGFMLGLGEKEEEIFILMEDILKTGCDILVVGQYLKPNKNGYEVKKFYDTDFFLKIKDYGLKIGFRKVFSGIFYRSSYLAESCINIDI